MVTLLNRRSALILSGASVLALSTPLVAQDRRLRLAFIPQENPEKLLGDIAVVTAWLADEIGVAVEGFVTIDHAAAVEALRNGDADISFMGALPFVLAEAQIGAVPLLSEVYRGAPSYTGRIFVRRDSGIKTLSDLRDRDIAFADPISESGYLYPLAEFERVGLIEGPGAAEAFFGRIFFAGGYQQAMQAMAEGLVEAAGASQYADLLLTPDQQAEVTWIAESDKIPSHVVIARPGLDADIQARFVEAMLTLNQPANRDMLRYLYGPDGYVVSAPGVFDGVRDIARHYGLLR
ncbi:phosphonate transport system substrate-binding protein [Loktanella sp. PT4BL]|jgi:phosphonate transport system substrate-binding protein|uniref:phosphate/phosphite/phosphonate ABC transporter substrate-binding protein n=1 Tax=unclassified Loktanella TaxID=290910 RepID=UPI0006DD0216|nr:MULTISPECIES: phosphate/phosphite/phosphonate ABC transporter substrate-binding protein [unclassified Loktanella]KQB95584.1 phosphonate ABC transporter substrate-binding protein [Loktanella sp. 1ANDIMAR09]KQI70907.1 phosphonate ABC transporter substrate-binding protein [Loktanella sp. 5RATIMAR09]PXW67204.1 phosphonate transport system substrate-binding protein [Loktanella sp. PT4BL]